MTTAPHSSPLPTIAFIGLGNMGRPMVAHLLAAGYGVRVYARRPEAAAPFITLGAVACSSPAEAATQASVVITNVTHTTDVEEVLLGAHGIIQTAQMGTLCIDHSTISAPETKRIAAVLAEKGIDFIDAPVSGGVKAAQAKTLSIMMGGNDGAVQRALPILSVLGTTITHIGPVGSGQIAKACNQMVQVINIQGIAEAMRFAQVQGADLGKVLTAISAGMAGSKMLDLMGPKMVARDFSAGIEARLHAKDLALIEGIAEESHLHLPNLQATHQQLEALMEQGFGVDDTSSLLRVLEANK